MFDRLFNFISSVIHWFKFWKILHPYEKAVILRLGHLNRVVGPGLHFLIPFGVEEIIEDNVVLKTLRLLPQTVQTADGKAVTVTAVVTYEINDIQKAILEVEDIDDAVVDAATSAVSETVLSAEWEELTQPTFKDWITESAQESTGPYGISIIQVQLADVAECINLRLLGSKT